jgi:ABC-type glycerol-3-phosphate transport system permease component
MSKKIRTNRRNRFNSMLNKWNSLGIGVKIFLVTFFVFFVVQVVIHSYPFLWVINNSLKSTEEFNSGVSTSALTTTWAFINYIKVFDEFVIYGNVYYLEMLWNSVWQTFVYLFVNLAASVMIAYALARFRFPGRGFLYGLLIFIQTIPIIGTGAAAYKLRYALGMINNPYTIWFYWMNGFDYSAFIMFGAFVGISKSYSESAELDGASELQILLKVMLPQVLPLIIALLVTNFVGRWNDYQTAQISLNEYPSLAYGMYLFQLNSNWSASGKVTYYAALVMTALPGVLMYTFFQNIIIKNVSVGGIKG